MTVGIAFKSAVWESDQQLAVKLDFGDGDDNDNVDNNNCSRSSNLWEMGVKMISYINCPDENHPQYFFAG